MARPAATEEQRDAQRRRIREAAADLYREGGLPALSVRAVAGRAGVSTGLLYSYFSDMSALLRTLWAGPVAEFGRTVDRIVAQTPDPIARIDAVLSAFVEWVDAHPDVHRGVLLLVRPPTDEPPGRQDPDGLAMHRALRDAVAEGQQQGRVREGDPREIAQMLWAGVHGALALPVNLDAYDIAPARTLAPLVQRSLIRSIQLDPPADTL